MLKKVISAIVILSIISVVVISISYNATIMASIKDSSYFGNKEILEERFGIPTATRIETLMAPTLQEREQLAIWKDYNAYNIVTSTDKIVLNEHGQEYNLDYGFTLELLGDSILLNRDGFSMIVKDDQNFIQNNNSDVTFKKAKDSTFVRKTFCPDHNAIWATSSTCYPNLPDSFTDHRGPFKVSDVSEIFKAFVIVERTFRYGQNTYTRYCWALQTCDCIKDERILELTNDEVETVKEYVQKYDTATERKNRGNAGRWIIPDVGVNVAFFNSNSSAVCDAKDSAVYYSYGDMKLLGDHNNQGFNAIKKCDVGTIAYKDDGTSLKKYVCTNIIQGHNTGYDLTTWNGDVIKNDYNTGGITCYTCNDNWKNVTIVSFQPCD